ncbi:hypothetical protein A2U01_0113157, partial [Trifolium medium]|nr:hypothetical protein [Trifolium medium]
MHSIGASKGVGVLKKNRRL